VRIVNKPAVLLATNNPGKLREMRALLAQLPVRLADPATLGLALQVKETGGGYAENAQLKAQAYATASGWFTLADDTGLEVDALHGAPGLHSARLLQPGASDADRRARLLEMLAPFPHPWTARFRCAMALAGPDGRVDWATGECGGQIVSSPRGEAGFGYDPLFEVEHTGRTMAELDLPEKNRISHRARALAALLPSVRLRLGLPD
jgi:XTP/dITP diphosphohydrolase